MKVQDIRKECSAIVGLSLEFSNSEIACIDRLLWDIDKAVDNAINQQITTMKHFEQGCHLLDFEDDVPAAIDLRNLKKIQWLLTMITRRNMSDLFNEANRQYEAEINCINNSVSSEPIK